MKSDLEWNGSYLGDFDRSIIKFERRFREYQTCFILDIFNQRQICLAKECRDNISIVLENIKPFFGLKRFDNHWLKIGRTLYIIFKAELTSSGRVKTYYNLSEYDIKRISRLSKDQLANLTRSVRSILAFRDLLSISCTWEKSIIIDWQDDLPLARSLYEPSIDKNLDNGLSKKLIDKWFRDDFGIETTSSILLDIFKIDSYDSLCAVELDLKKYIKEIIKMTGYIDENCLANRISDKFNSLIEGELLDQK